MKKRQVGGEEEGEKRKEGVGGRGTASAPRKDGEKEEGAVLKAELKKAEQEKAEFIAQLQRLQAEFENYQKRVAREEELVKTRAKKTLLKGILPIMDNFELALKTQNDPKSGDANAPSGAMKESCKAFIEGVELIFAQLKEFLEEHGVQEIPAEGVFDPARHEALLAEEQEGVEKGTILEVLQKGYLLDGTILRAAKVKVAK